MTKVIRCFVNESNILYSSVYDSYCLFDGSMYINDGKVSNASFWTTDKARVNSFIPLDLLITTESDIKKNDMCLDIQTNVVFNAIADFTYRGNSTYRKLEVLKISTFEEIEKYSKLIINIK